MIKVKQGSKNKYKVEILSPIHIGSGNEYRSIDYIEKKEEVWIFDEKDVIENISPKHSLDNELLNTISYGNQRKEYFKGLDDLINKGIIDKKILKHVKIKAHKKNNNLKVKEIKGMMRNFYGPYIPGGTIKGIIRTAILYDFLLNKGISYIKDAISRLKNNYRITIEDIIIGNGRKDIKKDPFRFLSIPDVNIQNDAAAIYGENIFNINKPPYPTDVIETISENNCTEDFSIHLDINRKVLMYLKIGKELIPYFNEEKILEVLYKYAKDLIQEEIEYFESCSVRQFNSKEILMDLRKYEKMNKIESPILRIGKSTGYLSHTVGLAIKKLDANYYNGEFLRFIKPPEYSKNYSFPKTRKFIGQAVAPKLLGFAVLKKVD